jgi:hypothetical protein
MESIEFDTDITLRSRYECKYLISPMLVPGIREFISPFMQPDRFAALLEDHRYPICSLYLDAPDLTLYQQTVNGEKHRFKLRVRTYTDYRQAPVFFEVKRKVNNIVQKRRSRTERSEALAFLEHRLEGGAANLPTSADDLGYFAGHMELAAARPVVRVRYMREAYESKGGDPVRVTLDSDLSHAVTLSAELSHRDGRWVTTPVDGIILELKFTEIFPSWIGDLVRTFDLRQQPVPKYVMSVDHMMLDGRESVLGLGGFTLPAWRA